MEIRFSDLSHRFFQIEDLYACRQPGTAVNHYATPEPRPTTGLLFFYQAEGVCTPKGQAPFFVPQGSVMLMPKGSEYTWRVTRVDGHEQAVNLLFEFSLYDISWEKGSKGERSPGKGQGTPLSFGRQIRCLTSERGGRYEGLFLSLIDAFHAEPPAPLATQAAAYALLCAAAADCQKQNAQIPGIALIQQGIHILEQETIPEMSLAEIAALCHVSVSYFEKLFRLYAGISPAAYRTARRIRTVKQYLANTDLPLSDIADKLGFYDSAYLCRLFRQQTGLTPRAYRQAARTL